MTSKYFIAWALVLCLAGCSRSGPGRLYSNVTLPYSTDFNNTPVAAKHCILKDHRIREPVSGYGVSVEWSTDQIQSAAREAGISTIRYIDIQTISFVLGIYTRRKLIIYGD
jgi:hypothetical protein